jgi:hypothetical protein
MLVSSTFLKNSLENYNIGKTKEKFSISGDAIKSGFSNSFNTFILAIAIIFFILELYLLYFAISIALYCSSSKEERIVNFVLATIFTSPYVLIKIIFDPCSKQYLKNGLTNV